MGLSNKIQSYLTAIDRALLVAGSVLTTIETSAGQIPFLGVGVAAVGLGTAVIKYAEKETSDPAVIAELATLKGLYADLKAKWDAAIGKPDPVPTPQPPTPQPTPAASGSSGQTA